MSRKTSICVKNVSKDISLTLTRPITSDSVQTVVFKPNNKNAISISNPTLIFDKNNLSRTLSVVGNTSGSYNIEYTIKGNFTNDVLTNLINVEVVNENQSNGFVSTSQSCPNYLYIYENSEYFNGSILGVYNADSNSHSLSFRSSNSQYAFNVIAIDPSGNEATYTSSVTNLTGADSYRFIRVHVLTTYNNTGAPSWNEVEIYALDAPSTNIARSRSTSADRNYPGYGSSLAVDGSYATRWSATTGGSVQNFTVELTAAKQVYKVLIYRSVYDGMKSYQIQGSNDNSSYTTLYTSGVFNGYSESVTENSVLTALITSNVSVININISAGNSGLWKFIPASEFITAITGSLIYLPATQLTFIADSSSVNSIPAYYQGIGFMKPNDCIIP